jgi:hypothetical protein
MEFAGRNVLINAVAPGFIASDMTASIDQKYEEGILRTIPMGTLLEEMGGGGDRKASCLSAGQMVVGWALCSQSLQCPCVRAVDGLTLPLPRIPARVCVPYICTPLSPLGAICTAMRPSHPCQRSVGEAGCTGAAASPDRQAGTRPLDPHALSPSIVLYRSLWQAGGGGGPGALPGAGPGILLHHRPGLQCRWRHGPYLNALGGLQVARWRPLAQNQRHGLLHRMCYDVFVREAEGGGTGGPGMPSGCGVHLQALPMWAPA